MKRITLLLLSLLLWACSESQPSSSPETTAPSESSRTLELASAQLRHLKVEKLETVGTVPRELAAIGRVRMAPGGAALVRTVAEARVVSVEVKPGQRVKKGERLVRLNASSVAEARAAIVRGQAMKSRAEQLLAQEQKLQGLNATSVSDLTRAQQELALANAELLAASGQLGAWGATSQGGASVVLSAPISGVVTQVEAAAGSVVGAGTLLLRIVNPQNFSLLFQVPQSAAFEVQAGSIQVQLPGAQTCEAQLTGHLHSVDQQSMAVPFLAVPGEACLSTMMEGTLVQAKLALTPKPISGKMYRAPQTALTTYLGDTVAFLKVGESSFYPARLENVEVWHGMAYFTVLEGDVKDPRPESLEVVVSGTVLLKGELLRGQLE